MHGLWDSKLIKNNITLDSFKSINKFIVIGASKSDNLSRILIISDIIQGNSLKIYDPRKNLSIDELMIGYQGMHQLKQYIQMKQTKWSFKAFFIYESKTDNFLKHLFYI